MKTTLALLFILTSMSIWAIDAKEINCKSTIIVTNPNINLLVEPSRNYLAYYFSNRDSYYIDMKEDYFNAGILFDWDERYEIALSLCEHWWKTEDNIIRFKLICNGRNILPDNMDKYSKYLEINLDSGEGLHTIVKQYDQEDGSSNLSFAQDQLKECHITQ